MFSFDKTKLATNELLGTGQYGWVYPYRKDPSDKRWVVKHVYAKSFDNFLNIMQEIVLGFNCDHPSILPIRGFHVKESQDTPGWNIYIKMPRMQTTLKHIMAQRVKENKRVPEKDIVKYFYSLTCGLHYLHERRIAHRDIKPTNILVDQQGELKLADIGIAKFVADDETSFLVNDFAGTQLYSAPESYHNPQLKKKDLYKTDAWSLGVVMAEFCLLKPRLVEIGRPISDEEREANIRKKLAELDGKYSQALIDVILGLLRCNVEQRITVGEAKRILEMEFGMILGLADGSRDSILESKDCLEQVMMIKTEDEIQENMIKEIQKECEGHEKSLADLDMHKEGGENVEENKKEEPALDKNSLEIIKREMNEKWRDIFEFKASDIFTIQKVDSKKVTDPGIKSFLRDLETKLKRKNIKNLQQLSINLQACKQITDQGLKDISMQISTNFKRLQSLSLSFYGCDRVKDAGIKELITHISANTKDLTHLSLNFHSCKLVTDKGLKELTDQIGNNLKGLQHLVIDVGLCKLVTDQARTTLKNTLTYIPKIDLH